MAGEGKKLFAASEVALHASRKDCWVVIGGKVYDVTKFLEDHPGGEDVLLHASGFLLHDDASASQGSFQMAWRPREHLHDASAPRAANRLDEGDDNGVPPAPPPAAAVPRAMVLTVVRAKSGNMRRRLPIMETPPPPFIRH
ncbi:cytochrome b5-like isoform X2 [Miscanthus floridulus]|uniref:cytochrome b5-like isoform X2 n=1 Tax=Miscanthus floridulus TaxID=154761 RepID=UPI00345A01CB